MIIGYLLLIGGAWQLAAGVLLPVTALTAVGVLWALAGIGNVALSRRARTRARASGWPADNFATADNRVSADDLADPIARARLYRGTDGALSRGLIALACAVIAVGVGVWYPGNAGLGGIFEPWRFGMIATGAVVGFLCLIGLLVYASSGVERSAVHPATVVILGMREIALNTGGGRPYVRFVLDVFPHAHSRYEATIQTPVPALAVPRLTVGAQFPAQVAGPDKPNNVIVDWNSPIAI